MQNMLFYIELEINGGFKFWFYILKTTDKPIMARVRLDYVEWLLVDNDISDKFLLLNKKILLFYFSNCLIF